MKHTLGAATHALALALALAVSPAWGKNADWKGCRDNLLGPMRDALMQQCSNGRTMNSLGMSRWGYKVMQETKASFVAKGISIDDFYAWQAGVAAAMSQVCPNVW